MSASEAEGRRLYGPPSEGDEDPHANQYPSDPAETTGPPRITAGQLNSSHLGHTIRVTEQRGPTRYSMQGMLTRVEHEVDLVSDQAIGDNQETFSLGFRRTYLGMNNGLFAPVRSDATVELLD